MQKDAKKVSGWILVGVGGIGGTWLEYRRPIFSDSASVRRES